ncbi:MAG: hypothetical protein K5877_00535 [Lachnospiraceae bacterium]|nr:hypothetical protein [Lachnospiraceae bacterium]
MKSIMKDAVVYGCHTMLVQHIISERELKAYKKNAGLGEADPVTGDQRYYVKGIDEVNIREYAYTYEQDGQEKQRKVRIMELRLNCTRILGTGNYGLMPLTNMNIHKMIKAMSSTLTEMGIEANNADFSAWTVDRLDTAFDIKVSDIASFIQIMKKGLPEDVVFAKKQHKRPAPHYRYPTSVRFGNGSVTWNIYDKYTELHKDDHNAVKGEVDKPQYLTDIEKEKFKEILRVERQNSKDAVKKLLKAECKDSDSSSEVKLGSRSIANLLQREVQEAILDAMANDIADCFGKDDYPSQYEDGSVIEIPGLYYRIFERPQPVPVKRDYHKFPVPHRTSDGRYSAGIPFYSCSKLEMSFSIDNVMQSSYIDNGRKKQHSVAGRSEQEYWEKALAKITEIFCENFKYCRQWNESDFYDQHLNGRLKNNEEAQEYIKAFDDKSKEYLLKSYNAIKHLMDETKYETVKAQAQKALMIETLEKRDDLMALFCPDDRTKELLMLLGLPVYGELKSTV